MAIGNDILLKKITSDEILVSVQSRSTNLHILLCCLQIPPTPPVRAVPQSQMLMSDALSKAQKVQDLQASIKARLSAVGMPDISAIQAAAA